ncbi:MAG: 2-phosphosulfolactate phosphatase [Dermatophilaceae bacterium]
MSVGIPFRGRRAGRKIVHFPVRHYGARGTPAVVGPSGTTIGSWTARPRYSHRRRRTTRGQRPPCGDGQRLDRRPWPHRCPLALRELVSLPDDSLRSAVEDLWGAGAVIAALRDRGWTSCTPEARTAAAAWTSVAADVPAALSDSANGREPIDLGYADDVAIAAQEDQSGSVPLLHEHRFLAASNH